MCNGDLGMYRVMPWAYPTIPGQSSGGASVDPTPEPTPEYYDFTDAKIVYTESSFELESYVAGPYQNRGYGVFQISGVKSIDTSNVNRVEIRLSQNPTYTPSLGGTVTIILAVNLQKEPNSINSYSLLTNDASNTGKTVTVSGGTVKFFVYGLDGEVLQTAEVPIQ